MKTIRVAQFGLGPIGLETLKLAATKSWVEVVGGIDIDPAKIGKDLANLTGSKVLRGRKVFGSLDELLRSKKPDVIFHTAVSKFKLAFPQIEPMARAGISVVSSCEGLLFPSLREPILAEKIPLLASFASLELDDPIAGFRGSPISIIEKNLGKGSVNGNNEKRLFLFLC